MQNIFLAGDNDIGGEGNEAVSATAVRRFTNAFVSDYDLTQHDLVRRLNMSLFIVDAFQQTATCLPLSARGECTMNTTSDSLRVVLTHAPAMQANTLCYRLVQHVNGGLILSAHDHQARAVIRRRHRGGDQRIHLSRGKNTMHVEYNTLTGERVELNSPTCSYRMGTPNMGFALVQLRMCAHASPTGIACRFAT